MPDDDPNIIGEIPDENNLLTEFAENFAKELAKGMESLMRDIGAAAFTGEDDGDQTEEKQREFCAAWEAMLVPGDGWRGIRWFETRCLRGRCGESGGERRCGACQG